MSEMEEENSGESVNSEAEISSESEEGHGGKVKSKKFLIIIALVAILLIGGAAGLYFSGILSKPAAEEESTHKEGEDPKTADGTASTTPISGEVMLDMEEFLINLNNASGQTSFLKMTVTIVIPDANDEAKISPQLPRIRDSFQVYLRELRSDDLKGSAGLYRLREELLLRANKIVYPAKIEDILFKEILVQ